MGIVSVKTNFTAGQISDNLFGRGDLSVYENGARCLENMIIHPTGGVSRRKGLKLIDEIADLGKLIPFEFNSNQTYLLCLMNKKMNIYRDDKLVSILDIPWGEEHHAKLNWVQSADTLLVVHPDVEPMQITRNDGEIWKVEAWNYYTKDNMIFCPYFNFYQKSVKLTMTQNYGDLIIVSDKEIFNENYVGIRLKINTGLVEIISVNGPKEIKAKILKVVGGLNPTLDWEEQSFSNLRGWPNSITFHQDRMVIGGSKSLPNRLWLSRSSDLFNFDLGSGLDDSAIEFAILSDQVNAICNVISSRHLLVFTTGAEWMVVGDVLTPTSIRLSVQTNTGSYDKYSIAPQQINGATVFVSNSGKQLREFLYTDAEQSYLSKNLSILSEDMLSNPVCAGFSKEDNILYFVLEDGTISCLTSYRTEEVNAWSKLKTKGKFVSLGVIGESIYFITLRNGKYFIEKSDDDFFVDCGLKILSDIPTSKWSGLDIMEGEEVAVVSKGYTLGKYLVENASISLFEEVDEIIVGLPYEHKIEPMPYMLDAMRPFSPKAVRIIDAVFRIISSKSICVDIGNGYLNVPLKRMFKNKILDSPPMVYSGDVKLHSLRWIRDLEQAMWSIKSDTPLSFNLLSVVMNLKIKN